MLDSSKLASATPRGWSLLSTVVETRNTPPFTVRPRVLEPGLRTPLEATTPALIAGERNKLFGENIPNFFLPEGRR